jgi:hypothetical protein
MKKNSAGGVLREGRCKLLDAETSTWNNIWLVLHMADETSADGAIMVTARQEDKVHRLFFLQDSVCVR